MISNFGKMIFLNSLSDRNVSPSEMRSTPQSTATFFGRIWSKFSELSEIIRFLCLRLKASVEKVFFHDPNNESITPREVKRVYFKNLLELECPDDILEESSPSSSESDEEDVEPLRLMKYSSSHHSTDGEVDQTSNEKNIYAANECLLKRQIEITQKLLKEVRKSTDTWTETLSFIKAIREQEQILEEILPNITDQEMIVRQTLKNVRKKRARLEIKLCSQIKRLFTPNNKIKADEDCLFSSFCHYFNEGVSPTNCRKIAAEYIAGNPKRFEANVRALWSLKELRSATKNFSDRLGGKQAWYDLLKKKLKRIPRQIDFYCDCIENSNFRGGLNEIVALSESLNVQVLIFIQQIQGSWAFGGWVNAYNIQDSPQQVFLYCYGEGCYNNLVLK